MSKLRDLGDQTYRQTDRHNFASFSDQDFYMPFTAIICCLKAIKEMNLYIITGFGDFKGSYYGKLLQTFQVL